MSTDYHQCVLSLLPDNPMEEQLCPVLEKETNKPPPKSHYNPGNCLLNSSYIHDTAFFSPINSISTTSADKVILFL